jgi:hypothetical protein
MRNDRGRYNFWSPRDRRKDVMVVPLRKLRSNDTICSAHSEHLDEIPVPVNRVGSRVPAIVVSHLNGRKQPSPIVKNSHVKHPFLYFLLFTARLPCGPIPHSPLI